VLTLRQEESRQRAGGDESSEVGRAIRHRDGERWVGGEAAMPWRVACVGLALALLGALGTLVAARRGVAIERALGLALLALALWMVAAALTFAWPDAEAGRDDDAG